MTFRAPGVRFEFVETPSPMVLERTDVAGFLGIAERGPLHRPVRVTSFEDFRATFGGLIPQAYLAYGVQSYFANGGRALWVVRIADPVTARTASALLDDDAGNALIRVHARSPGSWGSGVEVSVIRQGRQRFTLVVRDADGLREIWPNLRVGSSDDPTDVSTSATLTLNAERTGSALIRVEEVGGTGEGAPRVGAVRLRDGADGLASLTVEHFSGRGAGVAAAATVLRELYADGNEGESFDVGLRALRRIREVAVVAIPDLHRPPRWVPTYIETRVDCGVLPGEADVEVSPPPPDPTAALEYAPAFDTAQLAEAQHELIQHCVELGDRAALIEPPREATNRVQLLEWRKQFDSSFVAVYAPWLRVPDARELDGLLRTIPPSCAAAGVWARVELRQGVHRSPANEDLLDAKEVTTVVSESLHGELNARGINVVRRTPTGGLRVLGARTVSSDTSLRFINARRILLALGRTLNTRAQSWVFEPNSEELWWGIDREVRALLERLWKAGTLDGATLAEAFNVRCDRETNTQYETDAGRAVCELYLNLPAPAEFVTARIGFTQSGAQLEGVA